MKQLIEDIKKFEGYKEQVYLDSLGFPTCGYGHHLYAGSRVSETCCEEFFKSDIADAINDFAKLPKSYTDHLNQNRARVITHLIFWIGLPKTLSFRKMWKAIEEDDFEAAANELGWSKLSIQVPGRCLYLSSQLRKG